jgi:hypothetical protein
VNSGEGWHSQTGRATLTVPVSVFGLLRFLCPLPSPVLSSPFLFPTHSGSTLPDLTRPSSAFPTTAARRAHLSLLRAHGRAGSSSISSISSRRRHSFTGRLRILDYRSMCFDTFSQYSRPEPCQQPTLHALLCPPSLVSAVDKATSTAFHWAHP